METKERETIIGNKYKFKTTKGVVTGTITEQVRVSNKYLYILSNTNTGKDYLTCRVTKDGKSKVKILGVTSPYMFK